MFDKKKKKKKKKDFKAMMLIENIYILQKMICVNRNKSRKEKTAFILSCNSRIINYYLCIIFENCSFCIRSHLFISPGVVGIVPSLDIVFLSISIRQFLLYFIPSMCSISTNRQAAVYQRRRRRRTRTRKKPKRERVLSLT